MWVDRDKASADMSFGAACVPVHKLVREQCLLRPRARAVSFRDESIDYGELGRRVDALSQKLARAGIGPGSAVAVCLQPSLETVVCLLGVLSSGALYVPLDPSYPPERLAVLVDEIAPAALLTQRELLGPRLPPVSETWCVEDLPLAPEATDELVARDLPEDEPAYIIYTSGTTGKPKGVMVSHRNLHHHIHVSGRRYAFSADDVMPAMARSTFSITMFEMFSPLVVGAELVILERAHVLDFRRLEETLRRCTVLHASPSLLRKFLVYARQNKLAPVHFDGLRHVSSGGDLVSYDLMEDLKGLFRKAELFVVYGCTEISCMGCTFEIPRDQPVHKNFVGVPFEGVGLLLLDEQQQSVAQGEVGEICFAGDGISLGYLKREDLTRERFVWLDGTRFYRTGDLGRMDEKGRVEILGRSDFQIKLRGIRIELGEIEATLRSAPGVRECVVSSKDLGSGEPSLVGYVASDDTSASYARELRSLCQRKLPDYMVPAVYVVRETLPVNMNQKLDRSALPMPSHEDVLKLRDYHAPTNDTERRLVDVWKSVLGSDFPIGVRDNFFDIGGSSLLTVTMMTEVERVFARTLPLSTMLTEPTIEALAQVIDGRGNDARASLVVLREGDSRRPVFFVHDGEGEIIPYLALAQRVTPGRRVYGVQPKATVAHPMLHSRLDEVVEYYTEIIRTAQPTGPYYLGGLCIGGFIALEVARRIQSLGGEVRHVFLLDAAHVHAQPKSRNAARASSLRQALRAERERAGQSALGYARVAVGMVAKKASNMLRYEFGARLLRRRNRAKVQLFRFCLDQKLPVPAYLRGIPVQVVLRFAEREFVQRTPYQGPATLVRATEKSPAFDGTIIDDTPYRDNFASPALGWEGKLTRLTVVDAPGGHSSMLQDLNVDVVAKFVNAHLDKPDGGERPSDAVGSLSL